MKIGFVVPFSKTHRCHVNVAPVDGTETVSTVDIHLNMAIVTSMFDLWHEKNVWFCESKFQNYDVRQYLNDYYYSTIFTLCRPKLNSLRTSL